MIGNELRRLRKERGLYQSDVAASLNVAQPTVASWENGTRIPDADKILALADYFGVSIDEIFGRSISDDDKEIWELREQYRCDPERRVLFSLAKNGDISDVRRAIAILDALEGTKGGI